MDLDLCVMEAKPTVSKDDVSRNAKFERRKTSKRLSLMVIKKTISEIIYGGILSSDYKDFLRPFT